MARQKLEIEYKGVVYTAARLKRELGLSITAARLRIRLVKRGERPLSYLMTPKHLQGPGHREKDETPEQEALLADFRRLTANDRRIVEKHYPPPPRLCAGY